MCICFLKSKAHKVTLKELLLFYYSEFHQVRAEEFNGKWGGGGDKKQMNTIIIRTSKTCIVRETRQKKPA